MLLLTNDEIDHLVNKIKVLEECSEAEAASKLAGRFVESMKYLINVLEFRKKSYGEEPTSEELAALSATEAGINSEKANAKCVRELYNIS